MVSVQLREGHLVVKGDNSIADWEHRMFLTVAAGFRQEPGTSSYVYRETASVPAMLKETIEYFTEKGIRFELDPAAEDELRRLRGQDADFAAATSLGKALLERRAHFPDVQADLVRPLKPYQTHAVQHMLAIKNGANFSVPGSGKTAVVYAMYDALRRAGQIDKMVVFGPRSSFQPWEDEARATLLNPPVIARLTGTKQRRHSIYMQSGDHEVFLSSYQTGANDSAEIAALCRKYRVLMVIDESHNIKRIEGGIWAEAMLELAPHASRRVVLSGTPAPNSLEDLWTQITFLWPDKQALGERAAFRARCEEGDGVESVRRAVRPLFVRVAKHELGLPPVRFERIPCEMRPFQAKIYAALAAKYLRELDLAPNEVHALRQWRKAKMVRLIQTASNPALLAKRSEEFDVPAIGAETPSLSHLIERYHQFEVPVKIQMVERVVRDLVGAGLKAVVWTTFIHNIRMLQKSLGDLRPFMVYGAVPRDESEDIEFNREQQIRYFKETRGAAVLLANPAACAESISLHKTCLHAIYLDRTFNCGQYMQSLDRVHRLGLSPNEIVTYHILTATSTIDETVDRRLEEKQSSMLRLLEDDLPVGTFETEHGLMEASSVEEETDFAATLADIRHSGDRLPAEVAVSGA